MSNILSNALRFTPVGGHVEVRCGADAHHVEIVITDSGEGIAADFLPYVFDRFRQADSRSTRRHGGLGLGLAIARYLVHQHNGEITAESAGPQQGTTIRVQFPLRPAPAPAEETQDAWLDSVMEVHLHGATVVVVDDHQDSRELVGAICERGGARVISCGTAAAALAALETRQIDLLVADIAMPDVDGYTLVRRVRVLYPSLPCIAVSAYVRDEDQARALAAGFSAYCVKPLDAAAFARTVRRILLK